MKFCIDARSFFFHSGVGTYANQLVPALAEAAPEHDFVVFISNRHDPADAGLDFPNVHVIVSAAEWEAPDDMTVLSAEVEATGADACFIPFRLAPYKLSMPSVLNVNDILPATNPEYFPHEIADRFDREAIHGAILSATKIICLSGATRDAVALTFGIPAESMEVVHPGVSGGFMPRSVAETSGVLEQYALTHGRYMLFTGVVEPRKNVLALIRAYERNETCAREGFPLVISGKKGWDTDYVYEYVSDNKLTDRVSFTGRVPQEHLPALMSGAAAFAYLSLHEGFGLPVLEALASGVPVVASDIPPVREVAGGAAILVDPNDEQAINEAISESLSETRGDALRAAGPGRAKEFTWREAARRVLSALLAAAKA